MICGENSTSVRTESTWDRQPATNPNQRDAEDKHQPQVPRNISVDMLTVKKVHYNFVVHVIEASDWMSVLQSSKWWSQTELTNGKSNCKMDRLLYGAFLWAEQVSNYVMVIYWCPCAYKNLNTQLQWVNRWVSIFWLSSTSINRHPNFQVLLQIQ